MKTITSRDNPVLKSARKLLSRKGREEAGAFLVPGKKLISEAAAAGFKIDCVFVNAGALLRDEAAPEEYANEIVLEEGLFRDLAQTVNPQPFIAVVRRQGLAGGPENIAGMHGGPERVLILDRISDPGNVGTMIRTALAAGLSSVWCVRGTADAFSDKAIRASAGAVFHMPVAEKFSAQDCIDRIGGMGVKLFVCSPGGGNVFKTEFTDFFTLVIGSENEGPQKAFLDAADAVVGIPMAKASESLNAASAAAVVMYEALRQRS